MKDNIDYKKFYDRLKSALCMDGIQSIILTMESGEICADVIYSTESCKRSVSL